VLGDDDCATRPDAPADDGERPPTSGYGAVGVPDSDHLNGTVTGPGTLR